MSSPTFADDPESLRITRVVHAAADAAFQARVAEAIALNFLALWPEEIARHGIDEGITPERWVELSQSTRNASSPEEFQGFARALSVSARWLAIGSGSPIDPPPGWYSFGTHLDRPEVALEFSCEFDESAMPRWERPRQLVEA